MTTPWEQPNRRDATRDSLPDTISGLKRFIEDARGAERRQGDRRKSAQLSDDIELDIDALSAQPGVADSHAFSIRMDEAKRRLDILIDQRLSALEAEEQDARKRFDAFEAEQAALSNGGPVDQIHQIQRKEFSEQALARTKEYNELRALLRQLNEKTS